MELKHLIWSLPLTLLSGSPLLSQNRVDPRNRHERVILVVPMIGAGTPEDPRRPMYAPFGPRDLSEPDGIIAFTSVVSDDGRFAIVELVARDRAAFKHILAEKRPEVKIFEKGKATKADVEREFRKLRKDFDLDTFGVVAP